MKLLVCISKVPDTTSKINFVDNNTKFDENGVQYIVNPYDEWYALVRALELVEAQGGSVTTITVGSAADDPTIRKALAIGANDAVRIDADPSDPYFVAKQIAEYAKNEDFDIILTGKETINYNGAQIGGMIAEMLNTPFVSLATKLGVENNVATLERDVKGMYRKARLGKIKNFTGIDSLYEEPDNPDLVINTEKLTIEQSVLKIMNYIKIKIKL